MNNNKPLDDEAVLLAFSVETEHSPATLQRYLTKYPHLASHLIDLSLDLQFTSLDTVDDQADLYTPELDSSWSTFTDRIATDAAQLSTDEVQAIHSSLAKPEMREIGLPLSALQAIRGGGVLSTGFPTRWLAKIASIAGVTSESVRLYLDRPSQLSASVSYKSVDKPSAVEKVSFGELIASTNLTEDEKSEILREE